ncbi:PHP domain-containing protein [Thermohalobacter berrensis]|uniref:Polymerase/histidinol phosphatase N-terminal domain-containing protein n=1 Tax=Thermohalobacter berrensis TaxID=99594 RepID=A0A419TAK7_9FIRM|nr:PHP domain-containing protein [Thermohalobacter berrensis]RKD34503.1 hypothetical protein BET03_01340 [Thermohalobacter berrensis]
MDKIDLHVHTSASDSLLTPEEVIEWAVKKGIKGIAITDHDTVEGIDRAINKAKEYSQIMVIPGIEFSCDYKDEEIHILGYFIDYKSTQIKEVTKRLKDSRLKRGRKMIEKLSSMGFDISIKDIEDGISSDFIGRPHIARVLVEKGYADSVEEAFEKYINKGRPGYVKRKKLSIDESINLIHKTGGVAVIAHPGLIKNKDAINLVLQKGIDGIEAIHSKHTDEDIKYYKHIAEEFKLFITGGSDCHGKLVDGEPILGDFFTNLVQVKKMKEKSKLYKSKEEVNVKK